MTDDNFFSPWKHCKLGMINIQSDIQLEGTLALAKLVNEQRNLSSVDIQSSNFPEKYNRVLRSPIDDANLNVVESPRVVIFRQPFMSLLLCTIFPDRFCLSNDSIIPSKSTLIATL